MRKTLNPVLSPKFAGAAGLPRNSSVPDWTAFLILLPGGKFAFAELKAPGKNLRPLQALRKRQLEKLGFRVFVIDGTEQIGGVLDAICAP